MDSDQTSRKLICKATRKDGQPCQAIARPQDGYCIWHSPDPEVMAMMHRARTKPRKTGRFARVIIPDTAGDSEELVAWCKSLVLDIQGTSQTKQRTTDLFRALELLMKAYTFRIKYGAIADRLKALEERYKER